MSTLKKVLMTATMLTALAGSAHAETVNKYWNVEYWPKVFDGACVGQTYYGASKVTLTIGKSYRDGTTLWGIMLANKDWKTKDKDYEIVIKAGPEKNPGYRKTLVRTFAGLDDGGLVVNNLTADEMNTLAFDGEATVWFFNKKDAKLIAALRIDNAANVIRAVGACLKQREPVVANKTETTKPPATSKKEENTGGFGTGFFVAPKYDECACGEGVQHHIRQISGL